METDLKSWETKSSTGKHLAILDGFRGLAILLVVMHHLLEIHWQPASLIFKIENFLLQGWIGVRIFFVLSGFLIAYSILLKRKNDASIWLPRGYVIRRIGKIIPPFYLSILIFLGIYWFKFHNLAYLKVALLWATGIRNFVYVEPAFNGAYWSLIVEAQFYIVLPLLFWMTRGLSIRRTTLVIFLLLVIIPFIARLFSWPHGVTTYPGESDPEGDRLRLIFSRFPCELDYFGWGVLFAGMYLSLADFQPQLRSLSLLGYVGLLILVIVMFIMDKWNQASTGFPNYWSIETTHLMCGLASFFMLFFVFDPQALGSRFFSSSWIMFIGLVSYEWFLFHLPVVRWFHDTVGNTAGSIPLFLFRTLIPAIVTFGFAVLVYRWFSLPILNRLRGHKPMATEAKN